MLYRAGACSLEMWGGEGAIQAVLWQKAGGPHGKSILVRIILTINSLIHYSLNIQNKVKTSCITRRLNLNNVPEFSRHNAFSTKASSHNCGSLLLHPPPRHIQR